MIITRTPYRISFFGGGTDYPVWYRENGGSVLSTTIDKYCYITCRRLPPFFKKKHRLVWSKIEFLNNLEDTSHPSIRETLKFLKPKHGIELHHAGDLPARSGMGSSSSFTVGLVNALLRLKGEDVSKDLLAKHALKIEQELIKENVGSQDQVAAAFGGFNRIDFGGKDEFQVKPVKISRKREAELQGHLLLFFTGISRFASEIAGEQIKKTPTLESQLLAMHSMVDEAEKILRSKGDIKDFGRLLDESWKIKRGLTKKITNEKIDALYEKAIKSGAIGGKLLGAGAGGFMLFFVEPDKHSRVKKALKDLVHIPFKFENLGSHVITNGINKV